MWPHMPAAGAPLRGYFWLAWRLGTARRAGPQGPRGPDPPHRVVRSTPTAHSFCAPAAGGPEGPWAALGLVVRWRCLSGAWAAASRRRGPGAQGIPGAWGPRAQGPTGLHRAGPHRIVRRLRTAQDCRDSEAGAGRAGLAGLACLPRCVLFAHLVYVTWCRAWRGVAARTSEPERPKRPETETALAAADKTTAPTTSQMGATTPM